MKIADIAFPEFTGIRCLMMPYIQGDPQSVPKEYHAYADILSETWLSKGDIGFLTIDESVAIKDKPHRGAHASYGRALHTEAGLLEGCHNWGGCWGGKPNVLLDRNVEILIANNLDDSCAVWDAVHENTTANGDIGHLAEDYPYNQAELLKSGEIYKIGILTPHESLPVKQTVPRQFFRIVSSGVYGRESYFSKNPLTRYE